MNSQQSYTLTIACGCLVYVSCHPQTGVAHTRVIERRGTECNHRQHYVGTRLWLWELLPETAALPPQETPGAAGCLGVAIPGSAVTAAASPGQLHPKP